MTETTLMEKILALPVVAFLITSIMGFNWQTIYYFVMTVWGLMLIYFRLRKEWRKRQLAKQGLYVPDTERGMP